MDMDRNTNINQNISVRSIFDIGYWIFPILGKSNIEINSNILMMPILILE
jgi:hypothetical protein